MQVNSDGPKGILIAAPSSGAGKTTVTLALLRALKNAGHSVVSAKSGPDYIDPKFHEAASGTSCLNLDAWAMGEGTLQTLAGSHAAGHDLLIAEGAMGLFDGAANGKGSAADLASALQLPVVLVVDCAKQAQSVAALVSGFKHFRSDVRLTGVILNRVGSARHEEMLRAALNGLDIEVLGAIPRKSDLILPERHLGLVQAQEHPELDAFLDAAARICEDHLDLDGIRTLAQTIATPDDEVRQLPSPLGQRISVARDIAFAFSYIHLLDHWRRMGAEISFFSPLANEVPRSDADAIYLPGGYPELHAGKLSEAQTFVSGVQAAAENGALIYGECGGYMILGDMLVDADGCRQKMLGLLPLETSFQTRKRHLGYRIVTPKTGAPWSGSLAAHEFHYASVVSEGAVDGLFSASDASGNGLPDMGLRVNNVMGSFAHVISRHQTTSSTQS
ncbi:cobyrinate a,c-diamide synthase [Labrenzia sp. R4_2]|uniref:cobyrinate a,c-diamide synthase n=1 Tax=Labrenzia sp. R4_2 TaxID=2821107 RepID=UPI001ADA4C42|nr:cobyrinate a,c-diamide synthase [Labrenzia sp. R4_2]MBO9420367.1 cobyrinate a,c-diamide synthase [Labrenzia sp. R4_2]